MDESETIDAKDAEVNVDNFGSIQPPAKEIFETENENIIPEPSEIAQQNEIQDIGTGGQAEPFEAVQEEIPDAEVFQRNDQQRNVTEEDNTATINDQMHMTHRYDLRQTRSSWRDRFADHNTNPIVLTNLSIPKAIKLYGVICLWYVTCQPM